MQRFFAVVGVLAVLVVLCAGAYRTLAPQQVGPRPLAQVPLTQIVSQFIGPVGWLDGPGVWPASFQLPSTLGLAITQITLSGAAFVSGGPLQHHLEIRVDGTPAWRSQALISFFSGNEFHGGGLQLTPAIVAPPGSTVGIGFVSFPPGITPLADSVSITLTGYRLTLSDFGQ